MAVLSVTEDQRQLTGGDLEDVFDITFTIPPSSAHFIVTVPQTGDPIAAAKAAIDAKTAAVNGILGI